MFKTITIQLVSSQEIEIMKPVIKVHFIEYKLGKLSNRGVGGGGGQEGLNSANSLCSG